MKLHMRPVALPTVETVSDNGQISAKTREQVKKFLDQCWADKEARLKADSRLFSRLDCTDLVRPR